MFKLSKSFRFETAHRLAKNYQGKCSNIHGHSWNGKLTIFSKDLNNYGMATDYSDIKDLIKPIEELLDHSIMLYEKDLELIKFCRENNMKHIIFNENPTSEVIAKWIYDEIEKKINKLYFDIDSVQIDETCTSSCIYRKDK